MATSPNPPKDRSGIEEVLKMVYEVHFQTTGLPAWDAEKFVSSMLKEVKEESIREGTWDLPENYGDLLLEWEATDDAIRATLARKRAEGVTDEDIRWWWNRHDLDRRAMLKADERIRVRACVVRLAKDEVPDVAILNVRKHFAIFGEPGDPTDPTDQDGPLPCELKDTVNRYTQRRALEDPNEYERDIQSSSSFNALVRREIRAGNI